MVNGGPGHRLLLLLVLMIACPAYAQDSGNVRPQIYGFGTNTPAGRGGIIRIVNTVADNNNAPVPYTAGGCAMTACETCSFRACLAERPGCNGSAATCARTVLFATSGTIVLAVGGINLSSPYLTIAGQTAPSPGIIVTRTGITITTHDVLLQHLRIRGGDLACNDSLIVYNGAQMFNIVADHVSISWSQDDTFTVYPSTNNVTFWRGLIAEGLNNALPGVCSGGGSDGHGPLLYADSGLTFVAQSLIMSNNSRCPYAQGGTRGVIANNLVYNCRAEWSFFFAANYNANGGLSPATRWQHTVIGNRVVRGPSTGVGHMWVFSAQGAPPVQGNQIYRSDNTFDGTPFAQMEYNDLGYAPDVSSPPVALPSGYVPLASSGMEAFVMANTGARPMDRDSVDARLIGELASRTGSASPASGLAPTLPVNTVDIAAWIPANPHGIAMGQTFRTNLDVKLDGCAIFREVVGAANLCPGGTGGSGPHLEKPIINSVVAS